jgi:hypothetical protein
MTNAGAPLTMFTPYYRRASQFVIPAPQRLKAGEFFQGKIESVRDRGLYAQLLNSRSQHLHVHGWRQRGLDILARLNDFKDYERLHDQV